MSVTGFEYQANKGQTHRHLTGLLPHPGRLSGISLTILLQDEKCEMVWPKMEAHSPLILTIALRMYVWLVSGSFFFPSNKFVGAHAPE